MALKKEKKKTAHKVDLKPENKAEYKTEHKVEHKTSKKKRELITYSHVLWVAIWTSVAVLYLSSNIAASQMIHPLYGKLLNNETDAWVTFFKVTRNEKVAQEYLVDNQGKYRDLQEEINKDNSTRLDTILRLKEYLALNTQAKDILVAIATLYKEIGDLEKANEYLQRAQEIDPAVTF